MVDCPFTKSTSIVKFGPFIGGQLTSLFSVNTTVSIKGLLINFVIQNVELFCILAGNGEYSFKIIELTTSFGATNVLPKLSVDFLDNVKSSVSQDEIIICSSFPKLARCVRYLLSFEGSSIFNFSEKALNKALVIISSFNESVGSVNFVNTSYSLPINSSAPLRLYGFSINVILLLPTQLG